MTASLAKTARRAAALGLVFLAGGLAWGGVISPLWDVSASRHEEIARLTEQLEHFRRTIALRPELERDAASRRTALAAATSFWTGPSAAAVSAAMQGALREIVMAGGGQVRSEADAGQSADQGFDRIGVRFDIEGSLETLRKTLEGLEASNPALFVDNLVVRAPENAIDPARPPMIGIELTAIGYVQLTPSRQSNLAAEARP